ncbi:response regulator transcription factor [Microlunatus parietis]|uniref:DNA-binding NarL/FixJ family response regulator n=1 Tax=Microlunatus parietis TaxID=682979 RepID=A0A7Y9L783_9ACTN|nr:response regulator transcription factor [Microlunatus parietis]NYE69509.1 DNA-binding NarL/FixJ family response regulator [Microlunatus parietis]
MTVGVIIVDDQALIRSAVRSLLDGDPELTVLGEARNGAEAVQLVRTLRPAVVVMDIRMPGMDGIEATRMIMDDPETAGCQVLILTTFEDDHYVFQALRAGASGFVGKGAGPDELVQAVRTIARGEALLSARATRALIDRFVPRTPQTVPEITPEAAGLTERELEIVVLVARGLSNDEIAEHLVISPLTVKTHINRSMAKLSVHDRAQLVIFAYEHNLFSRYGNVG